MGARLKQLFEKAVDQGGITMPVKIAAMTSITSSMAATQEDTPEAIDAVQRALDELLAVHATVRPRPAPAARPAPAGSAADCGGRVKKYFDFARQRGGVKLSASLAMKTCITSQTAETTPDTSENLAKVRNALLALLPPGVSVPNF